MAEQQSTRQVTQRPTGRWQGWLRHLWPELPPIPAGAPRAPRVPRDAAVSAALDRLSEEHRAVLRGRFELGRSVRQIARATGSDRTDVSREQLLALRALQHELESRTFPR